MPEEGNKMRDKYFKRKENRSSFVGKIHSHTDRCCERCLPTLLYRSASVLSNQGCCFSPQNKSTTCFGESWLSVPTCFLGGSRLKVQWNSKLCLLQNKLTIRVNNIGELKYSSVRWSFDNVTAFKIIFNRTLNLLCIRIFCVEFMLFRHFVY